MREASTGRRVIVIAAIAVLGVVVAVLAGMALTRAQPVASDVTPEVFTTVAPTPSATPTPTPTPIPDASLNRADERFLSFVGASGWRATAGACDGAAPLLQRMSGTGEWADVAPRGNDVRQIASLDAYADGVEFIGGVGDACAAMALRTFSGGAAWESYEGSLARSRYVDLINPALVRTRAGEIAAPCTDAAGLRAWGATVAVICDGQAWRQSNETWTALAPTNVKALAIDDAELIIGHQSNACAGLTLTRLSGDDAVEVLCAENVDPTQPVAIAPTGDSVAVWAADNVIEVTR